MKSKKLLSLLLSISVIFSILPTSAFSETSDLTSLAETLEVSAPKSLTLQADSKNVIDGVIIGKKGDTFKLVAYDENENETPVTWKNTSYNGGGVSLDTETGEVEIINDLYSSTSYLYFEATSTLDENITNKITVKLTGYILSDYQKSQKVALSADGQTAKSITITGGKSGHNIWSYEIPDGAAKLDSDPGNKNSIKFNLFRPCIITATFKLDINEEFSDTATITVTGVAVENKFGNREKTYLKINSETPNPNLSLLAFTEENKTIVSWSSSDESVATVDENGVVTAQGIGSAIITATDNNGSTGGIKVVCESEDIPYFENLQFLSSAIDNYNKDYIFSPTVTEYALNIKSYATSKLTVQKTTLYNADKYEAVAEYTDADGVNQKVSIKSDAISYLENIPFDETKIAITIFDKSNSDNKTTYNFTLTRPRDTSKTLKSSVIVPNGRSLLKTTYNGFAEGTMFKLNDDGTFKTNSSSKPDTGISASHFYYKAFVLNNLKKFKLNLSGKTSYTYIRYNINDQDWIEMPQGDGTTDDISLENDTSSAKITIQIIDDKTYADNIKAEKSGFDDCEPEEYTIIVENADASSDNAQIITATTSSGDWYPCNFDSKKYSYSVVVPKSTSEETLTYTVSEGATVKIGNTEQTPDDGVYTLQLTTSQKSLTVTSADEKTSNTYTFKLQKISDGYPDKVTDFLCINSQYTNGIGAGNAASPWLSLSGSAVSIGNFGGYITYYYEKPITNNPNNKYGIDFYVYGNAMKDTSTTTKTSFFEPAQAWVSEDGENWYALAGSAHYDDGVVWDYTVTYKKNSKGKTSWTDNFGNSNNGNSYSGQWPDKDIYCMSSISKDDWNSDSITLSGIALPSASGDIASFGTSEDAYPVKWGYADCFSNGTKGKDVNPYTDNTNFDLQTNGFDLEWAVDKNGIPVDVSDKEFHYVKIVTSSNMFHSSFGEKSAEISGMLKTIAQDSPVGKTNAPSGVTISDGADSTIVNFTENQQVYDVNIGDMKYVSISLNGAAQDDNIYINNTRIPYDGSAKGFKITKKSDEKLVRIIVQNGDKEPLIYILKLSGSADESNEIIEDIKLNVNGSSRKAETLDGKYYTSSVGYRISSISLCPVADSDVNITVNGEPIKEQYSLSTGENHFTIVSEKDGIIHTVTLTITKSSPPASSGTVKVYFTLLGDSLHGDDYEIHTLKTGGLTTWISKTAVEVSTPATVLDIFEKALGDEHVFVNADGNYISEIDGLAEFSNGPLSGWLYTLNGDYPNKGVAEQTVKNNDTIVFHYTDDYTQEKGSEKWEAVSSAGYSAKYTVMFETNGGSLVSSQKIKRNETVTKPETPAKAGYDFEGWYKDKEFSKKYDFSEKVTSSFTLYAKWAAVTSESAQSFNFKDVTSGAWYEKAVKYAVENNIFKGISETEFAPNDYMTRAMLATVIHRIENPQNDVIYNHNFVDISEEDWFYNAVLWANANEIIIGVSETEFTPNDKVTREQIAAILYRYAKFKGYDTSDFSDLSNFSDTDQVSDWALTSMKWAHKSSLINGTSTSCLSPKDNATRAQLALILMNFLENTVK